MAIPTDWRRDCLLNTALTERLCDEARALSSGESTVLHVGATKLPESVPRPINVSSRGTLVELVTFERVMVDEVISVRRAAFLLACVLGCTAVSGVRAQQPRGVAATETVDTSIVPPDARTTWTPGVPGGVPIRTAVCRTVASASFGDGLQDASAAIQAAVNACPVGQVVLLSAGTFLVNNLVRMSQGKMMGVDFNKDKTWIGASSAYHPPLG